MRTAFRFFVAAQSLAFAALIVVAAVSLTRDLAQVPAAIAGASLALGLFSVFPVRARALGVEAVYAWIARTPLARDGVASHRPFQFAAALAALGSSAAVRLPGFVADAGPRMLARFETDMANDGPLKTLWVWGIATLIVGFIYVWKKGIFDWGLQARAEARAEAKAMARQNREIKRAA